MPEMSSSATGGPRTALLDSGDYPRFLLQAHNEVLFVLRSLLNAQACITLHCDQDKLLGQVNLVGIEDLSGVMLVPCDGDFPVEIALAKAVRCATHTDGIPVQFSLGALTSTRYRGLPALRAALPEALLRLQRREYFRLAFRPRRLSCTLTPTGDAYGAPVPGQDFLVDDLGCGGIAVITRDADIAWPEAMCRGCTIELPEVGTLRATVRTRNRSKRSLADAVVETRIGCEFVSMPGPMATLVHRYILKVVRERKARSALPE